MPKDFNIFDFTFDYEKLRELMDDLYNNEASLEERESELKGYQDEVNSAKQDVESAKKAIFDFCKGRFKMVRHIFRVEWFDSEKYQQEYFFSAESAIDRYSELCMDETSQNENIEKLTMQDIDD